MGSKWDGLKWPEPNQPKDEETDKKNEGKEPPKRETVEGPTVEDNRNLFFEELKKRMSKIPPKTEEKSDE